MIPEILFIGGLGLAAWGTYALVKAYKERKLQLDYCRDVDARLRAKQKALDDADALISDYQRLCDYDNRIRFEIREVNPIVSDAANAFGRHRLFVVVAHDVRINSICFAIKPFHFNPDDPEDRDFARREAEELLEKLQER